MKTSKKKRGLYFDGQGGWSANKQQQLEFIRRRGAVKLTIGRWRSCSQREITWIASPSAFLERSNQFISHRFARSCTAGVNEPRLTCKASTIYYPVQLIRFWTTSFQLRPKFGCKHRKTCNIYKQGWITNTTCAIQPLWSLVSLSRASRTGVCSSFAIPNQRTHTKLYSIISGRKV